MKMEKIVSIYIFDGTIVKLVNKGQLKERKELAFCYMLPLLRLFSFIINHCKFVIQ